VGELTGHWAVAEMVRKTLFLVAHLSLILSPERKIMTG
jgi:hypothetical protein